VASVMLCLAAQAATAPLLPCPDAIAWAVVLPVVVQEDNVTCCYIHANSASVIAVAMAYLLLFYLVPPRIGSSSGCAHVLWITDDVVIPFLPVPVWRVAASFAGCSSFTLLHMPCLHNYDARA